MHILDLQVGIGPNEPSNGRAAHQQCRNLEFATVADAQANVMRAGMLVGRCTIAEEVEVILKMRRDGGDKIVRGLTSATWGLTP